MKKTSAIPLSLSVLFLAWLPGAGRKAAMREQTPGEYLNARPGVAYVGDEVCRDCHESQYNDFKKTGMGNSLSVPGPTNWPEFTKPVTLFSKKLGLSYSVSVSGGKMYHTESKRRADGKLEYSERHEVAYTVGSGDLGRSYLVAKEDALFVSPISYYKGIRGWDLSPGHEAGQFRSFTRSAGNLCVSCHSGVFRPTAGTRNRYQDPPFPFLAVSCERCHGPGELHVRERRENAPLRGPIDLSIVNPARLPQHLRDEVCIQCHLGGDARVLQPGKTYLDFRPGTPLGNVVAILTAPVAAKFDLIKALSHPEQMEMSRCLIESNGRLGCITCHDPHVQLRGAEAAAYFRRKCLTCHTVQSCSLSSTRRQATSPPDNCIRCHMPKKSVVNIGHTALTDHRILRIASQSPPQVAAAPESPEDLIYHTRRAQERDAPPDLRTQAMAYYEVSQVYPAFRQRGFALLEQAARELPDDPEVQAAYGLVLLLARPQSPAEAAQALQKAIDSGSPSVEVRTRLARIRLREGKVAAARQLYNEAVEADPYYTPAYFGLAHLQSMTGDVPSSIETLERILKYDPGNEEARTALADAKESPR
ncbi:MAG: hypothetical protein DMG33_10730 [Acidobacteria bacterium]|nr:MAG: hypothetical protein DMG33_10730 [Acidobacteriota bacterium]